MRQKVVFEFTRAFIFRCVRNQLNQAARQFLPLFDKINIRILNIFFWLCPFEDLTDERAFQMNALNNAIAFRCLLDPTHRLINVFSRLRHGGGKKGGDPFMSHHFSCHLIDLISIAIHGIKPIAAVCVNINESWYQSFTLNVNDLFASLCLIIKHIADCQNLVIKADVPVFNPF